MGKRVIAPALAALLGIALVTATAAQMGGMHGGMGMGRRHGGGMMGMHQPPHPIGVMMNGRMMHFDTPPMMMGGRVMVPMRGVFEHMGARVKWDDRTRTVTGTRSGREVELTVGKPEAVVDGRRVRLETPPQMYQSRVYVPLRFISESLGADVSWDQGAHQVQIASAAPDPGNESAASDPTNTVARGKVVYTENRCDACHTINGKGGTVGPNLSHVGSSLSKAAIEEQVRNGGGGMPAFKDISQKDLDALADYLGSLK
jgi:cytochrome c2